MFLVDPKVFSFIFNSGHRYLPTYQILMISDNVEFVPPIFYTVFWQQNPMGKLKFRTLMLITSKCIMIETYNLT
jgi:hypothetical protein